jgi:aerobic-type carbon monoxide dehydrogenase small subunit (CoxS/CutS family)
LSDAPLLSVRGLTVRLPRGADRAHAVEDVSMDLRAGEILCVVGESGSGKTTTLRILAGLEAVNAGRVLIDGADVRTIEESQPDGQLDPVQQAFVETGAFQCGFCTPGFVLMTRQLLDAHPQPTDDEIRHYLAGNLCRCAAYPEIIKAVRLAAVKRKG